MVKGYRRNGCSPGFYVGVGIGLLCAALTAGAQTVTPAYVNLGFPAAAVGTKSPQTLVAAFDVSGYSGSVFIPTAAMHYGHDYSVGDAVCNPTGSGTETCSFSVTFTPTLPGMRKDALVVSDGTKTLATLLVYGVGEGPLGAIQPGVLTQVTAPVSLYDSAVDENGTAYAISSNTGEVYSYTKAGVLTQVPVTGLNEPHQIAIDGAGTLYFAQETYGSSIVTYSANGAQSSVAMVPPAPYVPCSNAISNGNALEFLSSVAVDGAGDIFALEALCSVIFERKADGSFATFPVNPVITQPSKMAVDSEGNVFISGFTINELTSGGVQTEINTMDGMPGGAGNSTGLAVDASGLLYDTPYPGTIDGEHFGVAELPPTDYTTPELDLDAGAALEGIGLGSDGTFFSGGYLSLTTIDRSQGAVAFGEQNLGVASAAQTVQLVNIGNEPLTLAGIALAGDAGYATQATGTLDCAKGMVLAPGAYCQTGVTLTPAHPGYSRGTLSFTDDSGSIAGATQVVSLTGWVNGAYVTASPSTLNFGDQQIGTSSAAQTVTLTNDAALGTAAVGTPVSSNPVFAATLSSCGAAIAPGASCQMPVIFTPKALGTVSGTITASVSGGLTGETVSVGVSGVGVPAPATLNIAETIHVSDALPGLGPALALTVAETIHVADSLPGLGPALTLSVAEAIHVTDALPALGPALKLAVAETIHVVDSLPALGPALKLAVAETIHVVDSLPVLGPALKLAVAETIHVADSLPALGPALKLAVAETIQVADALPDLGPALKLSVAETIRLADALPDLGPALKLAVAETIHVHDAAPTLTARVGGRDKAARAGGIGGHDTYSQQF